MRLLAPAKINLHLRVGKPRAVGFHPILSWMCAVGLFDTLIVKRSQEADFSLTCDMPGLPCDSGNLVAKAARAMANALQDREIWERGVAARLLKRIPVGAGLGGGSSDGACMLRALNALWRANLSADQLSAIAAALGSDVPFFLNGESAICRGRGEQVSPIARPRPAAAVLLFPGRLMATAAVYKRFDEMNLGGGFDEPEPDWESWTKLDAMSLLTVLRNDLETPAFSIDPAVAELREAAERILNRPVRMTGSGSTLFTLFDGLEEAESAAQGMEKQFSISARAVQLVPAAGV